jgi:hypothetical protein
MPQSSRVKKTDSRKPYAKPSFTQRSGEQARTFLREHANRGQQGASELLELMFPDTKDSKGNPKKAAA